MIQTDLSQGYGRKSWAECLGGRSTRAKKELGGEVRKRLRGGNEGSK